jgi:hypothetical protein
MNLSRRSFLKLVGGAALVGAAAQAMTLNRASYVVEGEVVNYIGKAQTGFVGGQVVHTVLPFDGIGYPVQVWNNAFGKHRKLETYYDFALVNFRREVPDNFWHDEINCQRYNNLHTFVRTKRFGESIQEAVYALNFCQSPTGQ